MVVVPKSQRRRGLDQHEVDGAYTDEYTCMPPPLFMFAISLAEVKIKVTDLCGSFGELFPFDCFRLEYLFIIRTK